MGSMTEEMITSSARPSRAGARVWLTAAAVACGAALIAGCSSTTSTVTKHVSPQATTQTTKASPAACVHIKSMRTSLTSLAHVKMSATSAGELSSALTNIQHQLNAVKGQNLGAFSAHAKELSADLNKIKMDAALMHAHPAAAEKSLSTDVTQLKAKSGPIITEMRTVCRMP
jgi:hypothetical protein